MMDLRKQRTTTMQDNSTPVLIRELVEKEMRHLAKLRQWRKVATAKGIDPDEMIRWNFEGGEKNNGR